ncbi:hypothetical protein [Pseudomonas sp.]|uniref:hypothetical protein n=1 Tax=Pseudomonas sp. TaxID=306 RepID=UPI0027299CC3|nr:hypothetical protein [Pseudomonas sp.]
MAPPRSAEPGWTLLLAAPKLPVRRTVGVELLLAAPKLPICAGLWGVELLLDAGGFAVCTAAGVAQGRYTPWSGAGL